MSQGKRARVDMGHNVITISDAETGNQETVFAAPDNRMLARALWVYLVDNLRQGLIVNLDIETQQLEWPSGEKIPPDIYKTFMEAGR